VEVGVYPDAKDASQHGLVVLACGQAYWLQPKEGGFGLWVNAAVAEEVREQLRKYDRESVGWPPRAWVAVEATRRLELFTPLCWALATIASFGAQGEWAWWMERGVLDARAVIEGGEWWRVATALFLHGDAGHLTSNLVSGIFAFAAVVTTLGIARGWAAIGAAAVAGNVAMVWIHAGSAYRSLGASTAVFAALGVLVGRAVRVAMRTERARWWRAALLPLATGVAVLGLYGAGEQRVDVLAHVAGFGAGVVAGWSAAGGGGKGRG
jgi:Uncharacterized membrane protein (homolog of Drosophila rhomboid)